MKYLVAVGACYLDTILTVDRYPDEDEKLKAANMERRPGGNCANSLQVLQQLLKNDEKQSPHAILLAVLPSKTCAATRLVKSSFDEAVDLSHCIYREEYDETASSFVIRNTSSDSRTIVNYNGLREMTSNEFMKVAHSLGNEVAWYHFEGRIPDVTLECIKEIRRRYPDVKISVEVEKPGRPGLRELAAEADVVFYSKSWARHEGYASPEDCLRTECTFTLRATLLCCTWGDKGASVLELPSLACYQEPAHQIANKSVVDTLGAGDTFIAGMLYGLIRTNVAPDISSLLMFANELAGQKITQEGFAGLGEILSKTWRRSITGSMQRY